MLTSVTLTNFQVHRKLHVELGPFTVFSGPSNSGKSAVLRALAAMLRNDSVADYVTHGESNLAVKVTTQDGYTVTWEKGKTKNQYTLERPDGTKSDYKKVGAGVPEEISDVLRIGPIVMEDGTKVHVNLHEQQEAPFLIMDTAGYVAKVFGELTSAGKLFSAANEGNRRTREEKKLRTLRESDIRQIVGDPLGPGGLVVGDPGQLRQYEGLDREKEQLQCVATKIQTAKQIDSAASTLRGLGTLLQETRSGLSSSEATITRLTPSTKIDTQLISSLNSAATQLSTLLSDRTASSASLASLDESLPELELRASVDLQALSGVADEVRAIQTLLTEREALQNSLDTLPGGSEPVEIDVDLLLKLNTAITSMFHLMEQLWATQDLIGTADETIEKVQHDLKKAEATLAEIDTCPTCGQEITEDAAKHMTGTSVSG